jgi:hypothetical protein
LEVDLSGFPNVMTHFKRMQERPSVKKLLAYEKEVNDGFAKAKPPAPILVGGNGDQESGQGLARALNFHDFSSIPGKRESNQ